MLFVDYIRKCPSSPAHRVNSTFVHCEYQKVAHSLDLGSEKILTDQERFSIDDIHTGTDLDFFNNNCHYNRQ
jgi:hypothetical protein